jgi:hypothetical protein
VIKFRTASLALLLVCAAKLGPAVAISPPPTPDMIEFGSVMEQVAPLLGTWEGV